MAEIVLVGNCVVC